MMLGALVLLAIWLRWAVGPGRRAALGLGAARPGGDLSLRALAGFPDPAVADDIVKADAEIRLVLPLPSLRAGQVVGMADLDQATAGFPVLGDLVARMGVASLALVPLLSRGRFLGLLALCWTQRHQLNREQEALLGPAGNQIAGAWRRPCAWRRPSGRPARPRRCSTPSPTGSCSPTPAGGSRP